MSDNKTKPTEIHLDTFLATVPERRVPEARTLDALMRRISGAPPVLWGKSLVGYGQYHYRYESGREGDCFRVGFSPRTAKLTLYIMDGSHGYDALMARLGKHTTGASCLYLNKLDDVDLGVLEELVRASWEAMAEKYPS